MSGKEGSRLKVTIGDSAVRAGLQSVRRWVPTEIKITMIEKLVAAGIKEIQAASFVHTKAVPQMQDGEAVFLAASVKFPDVKFTALAPNLRGVQRALSVDCKYIGGSCSTTEEHNKANFNMAIDDSVAGMKEVLKIKGDANYSFAQICTFVCPFTGPVKPIVAVRQLERIQHPKHPYTKALLSAVPTPSIKKMRNRILLKGELISPVNPRPGCRFAPRCEFVCAQCMEKDVALMEMTKNHYVACHRVSSHDLVW